MAQGKKQAANKTQVKLVWDKVTRAPTVYTNQLVVSHSGGEFYLIFGEMQIPTILHDEKPPTEIKVKEVARIAVTPDMAVQFANVLSESVSRFLARLVDEEIESEEAEDDDENV